jgi:hypothetical protein
MELVLLAAMAFLVFALLGRVGGGRHQAAVTGGQRVREQLDALYAGEHEYARVTPAAFPDADLAFYDRAGAQLERMHFRRLADIEDLTVSRVYPDQRTFIRVLIDEGGVVRAGVYHFKPRGGLMWLLQVLGQVPRHVRVIELVTEVATGRFLSTSNTKGVDRLEPPPEMRVERLEPDASIEDVVARHRARVQQHVRAHPDRVPVQFVRYEDVLASVQRGNQASARWRQKIGRLTRDELERMQGGRPLNEAEEAFLREVQGAEARGRSGRFAADSREPRREERSDRPEPAVAAAGVAPDDENLN